VQHAVRSSDTKSSASKSSKPIKLRLSLLPALATIAVVCSLSGGADAAERKVTSGIPGGGMTGINLTGDQGGRRGALADRRIVHRTPIVAKSANERRYVPDEVLIQLASSVPNKTIDALGRRLRLNRAASFTANNITTFRWKILDRRPVPTVIRSLEAEPIVQAAQPNYTYQLEQKTSDQLVGSGLSRPGESSQDAAFNLDERWSRRLAKGEGR
jgi:hypothetical protein